MRRSKQKLTRTLNWKTLGVSGYVCFSKWDLISFPVSFFVIPFCDLFRKLAHESDTELGIFIRRLQVWDNRFMIADWYMSLIAPAPANPQFLYPVGEMNRVELNKNLFFWIRVDIIFQILPQMFNRSIVQPTLNTGMEVDKLPLPFSKK